MGSSSSVVEPVTPNATAMSPSASTQFREVQLKRATIDSSEADNRTVRNGAKGRRRSSSSLSSVSQRMRNEEALRRQNVASPDTLRAKDSSKKPREWVGKGPDFYSVVDEIQREQTSLSDFEAPTYLNQDDVALETFFHVSGREYTCMFQAGHRFYMDSWKTQDWVPFPEAWYKEGIIVTDHILENEKDKDSVAPADDVLSKSIKTRDDREGHVDHPAKGKLETYIFEEKRNGHYFFDKENGNWVHLPISWELHSPLVCKLLALIEEALPSWRDRHDMLASLRASNYDPQDCIATYLLTEEADGAKPLAAPRDKEHTKILEQKDATIEQLEADVKTLTLHLDRAKHKIAKQEEYAKSAEARIQNLEEQLSTLGAEAKTAKVQLEALQRERPRTATKNRGTKHPLPTVEPVVEKAQLDPKLVEKLSSCSRGLRKEQIKLQMEASKRFDELKPMLIELDKQLKTLHRSNFDQSQEITDLRHLYQCEAMQRKLLYNKLQELRGNIRVFARCRKDERTNCCFGFPSDRDVVPPGGRKPIKFDKVFTPNSTQEQVFEDTLPIITSCVDGYNVCIMAYGQTNSGKTHTMQGPQYDSGVNVRSIKELFRICKERENIDYNIKVSMLEIYNESIQDLLSNDAKTLELRAHGNSIILPGQTEIAVSCMDDISNVLKVGERNRKVAATKMNSQSSRSHLIFKITVTGQDTISRVVSTGTLTLCDLAGSERVGKSEAQGQRLVEAAAINKSLSALAQVFKALRTNQLHVPFRNSKLTHILQPSLSGDAKACLFVTISPDEANLSESLSSLEFGTNARHVQLGHAKRNVQKAASPQNCTSEADI